MGFLDRWFSRKDFDEKLREKISEDVFNGSFSSLNEIDQYLPEYRLAVLNLVKYYIEEEFSDELGDDNDFDNEQECAFLKNTVNDRFPGGINYINYAFSNKYKDEDNPQRGRSCDGELSKEKYTKLTLFQSIEKYGWFSAGKFELPPEFATYVRESWDKGEFSEKNIPEDKKRFVLAKEVFDELVENLEFPAQSSYSLMGAMWCECGWAFDRLGIVNQLEKGGGGVTGTIGWPGAGECWFGLTFWRQKLQLIKAINAPVPRIESEYAKEGVTHLCQLDWAWQVKILHGYIKHLHGKKWGKIMCDPESDPGEVIVASYAFKAGFVKNPTLAEADYAARKYMATHAAQSKNNTSHNTFAMQIFAAIKFSLFCENLENGMSEDEAVPTNDDVLACL